MGEWYCVDGDIQEELASPEIEAEDSEGHPTDEPLRNYCDRESRYEVPETVLGRADTFEERVRGNLMTTSQSVKS